jgi:hypothetical protein
MSFEQQEPEVNSIDHDGNGGITAEVRIVNACAECGTEMTEANLTLDESIDIPDEHIGEGHDIECEEESVESTMCTEGKGRGTKTFYGAHLTVKV